MNERTFTRRLNQFVIILNNHKHKDELLNIMQQQIADDNVIVNTD